MPSWPAAAAGDVLVSSGDVTPGENHDGGFAVALLRHPPVRDAAGSCYGRLDLALVPGWEQQLGGLTDALARVRPQVVWTSPSHRCAVVAEALGCRLGVPVLRDGRLRELDFGDWEGVLWDKVPRRDLDRWAEDPVGFAPPSGESGAALIARVIEVASLLRRQGRPCVVLSHGGPLRLLPALLQGNAADLLAPAPPPGRLDVVMASARSS